MFSLFGQSKANLLLIDADEVLHLRWQGGKLSQIGHYYSTGEDFDRFHVFLENDRKTPFSIVTDVIEEDFRTETVVHVTGADRKAMIARKLAHLFRTTRYRTARVIGREKEGRKDDRILFTALTKSELIEPWLSRILAHKIPVTAVTSAAYVMEHFAQSLSISNSPQLLLVNQEGNSGLRQTYLQKGRVIFSRLTPAGVSRSNSFAALILEQCDQTRKYLERIKQLPFDTPLDVHVFTPEPFTEERESKHDLLQFHYRSVEELPLTKKIKLEYARPGAIAYSLISGLRKRAIPNVYAPASTLRYFHIRRIGSALYALALLSVLGAVVVVGPTLADTNNKWEQVSQLDTRTAPLLREYETLTERFPETPIQSAQMEIVVSASERIAAQLVRPNALLALISQGLAVSPNLTLSSVEWHLVEAQPDAVGAEDGMDESIGPAGAPLPEHLIHMALAKGNTQVLTTVRGIVQSEASFRDATAQVMAFVNALQELGVASVKPISLPMDVSSDRNVVATVDGGAARGEFAIEFLSEAAQ